MRPLIFVLNTGYSWLTGRFNKFEGIFNFDENNVSKPKLLLILTPASVDTNHAERQTFT